MGHGDMFLKVEGQKQGPIKGEANDKFHVDEIDVLGWSWGMRGSYVHGSATGKATVQELRIVKHVDRASTALMSSLRNNEMLKKVVLTVRKAGGGPVEFFKITMEQARIKSLDLQSGEGADPAVLVEHLSIVANKISVEHKVQGPDGQALGTSVFEAELLATE
jgi:type VI secretion system secreted protein Hcp